MNDEEVRDLIESVEDLGVLVELEDENLRIVNGKDLPEWLLERLRRDKSGIVSLLTKDKVARENGFLILRSGEAYEIQFSHSSSIFIQKVGEKWDAWRETWQMGRSKSVSSNLIIEQVGFDYAMFKAKERLNYVYQQRR